MFREREKNEEYSLYCDCKTFQILLNNNNNLTSSYVLCRSGFCCTIHEYVHDYEKKATSVWNSPRKHICDLSFSFSFIFLGCFYLFSNIMEVLYPVT